MFPSTRSRRAGTGKSTDNIVLSVIKEYLDMELLVKDLDRSHRIHL